MQMEIELNGRLEEDGQFGAQDFRLSLSDDELCLEIVGYDMELFIEANDLIEAIAQLKMGGDDLRAMVHEAVRRHLEYLSEAEHPEAEPLNEAERELLASLLGGAQRSEVSPPERTTAPGLGQFAGGCAAQ
jgi:hypothetical protein